MRFDLIKPCENCPFSKNEHRIVFAARSRAEEIEELAYREGFVCHEHADVVEDGDYVITPEGYYPRIDGSSQHCFGALYMYLRNGSGNIPWEYAIEEDEELEARWWNRITLEQINDANKSVWDGEEEFFKANEGPRDAITTTDD